MAAAAAMIFASCSKDGGNTQIEDGNTKVVVRIAGGNSTTGTRAEVAPGAEEKVTISDGYIYVINEGSVIHCEALDMTKAGVTPGQTLIDGEGNNKLFPSNSTVYVLGNAPTGIVAGGFESWTEIAEAASTITEITDGSYLDAPVANSTGAPAELEVGTGEDKGTASVAIQLTPLFSRMELVKVKGGPNVVSFKIGGIYVDGYYKSFTMSGAADGDPHTQGQGRAFGTVADEFMGDAGEWTSDEKIAAPDGKVWAYHMASAGLPRFIIHLSEVTFIETDIDGNPTGNPDKTQNNRYITVTGYTGLTSESGAFERGKIYVIGGTNGITFDERHLGEVPNITDVTLNVNVEVLEWDIEDLDYTLVLN